MNTNTSSPSENSDALQPLEGEAGIPNVAAKSKGPVSKKAVLALGLLVISLIAVSAISIQRFTASGKKQGDDAPKRATERPTAAAENTRKLEMPRPALTSASSAASAVRVPALVPTAEELNEPIGVRRGSSTPSKGGDKTIPPEDAPVLLVSTRPSSGGSAPSRPSESSDQAASGETDALESTRRNLQGYQRQLQGLMSTLGQNASAAQPPSPPPQGVTPSSGLFGGQLQGSSTPRTTASVIPNRALTLPKGTAFTCALKTKVISSTSGLVGCSVQRNIYSEDGRILLVERGSHMDGEYRIVSVKPGTVRIPVIWTRIRTPNAVTVDIDSPGTGPLGESGIDGYVDNRWSERLGAAMLLSLIDDSVKLVIQNQSNESQADTIVMPSTTNNTSKLAEKVLESTINIPPLIYQNQGGIVGIYVARDVDFSSVYELKPVAQ